MSSDSWIETRLELLRFSLDVFRRVEPSLKIVVERFVLWTMFGSCSEKHNFFYLTEHCPHVRNMQNASLSCFEI